MLTSQSEANFIIYMLINADDPTVHIIIFIIQHAKAATILRMTMHNFQAVINCELE